jgi:hypothetical protein
LSSAKRTPQKYLTDFSNLSSLLLDLFDSSSNFPEP